MHQIIIKKLTEHKSFNKRHNGLLVSSPKNTAT